MGGLSRLCDLITTSLLPFLEAKPFPLTKESEKDLLLSLSRVSKEIYRWRNEFSCESGKGTVANSFINHNCLMHLEEHFGGDSNCLANVISTIVTFLGVDSMFVQHLTGNILLSASNLLINFGSEWIKFIQLLWISLEATMSSGSGCTLLSSTIGSKSLSYHNSPLQNEMSAIENSDPDITTFTTLIQSKFILANWRMVATSLFQILRSILKFLKHEYGDLERIFKYVAVSSLLKMPWDLFGEIQISSSMDVSQMNFGLNKIPDRKIGLSGSKYILSGVILQLFCSLVERGESVDVKDDSLGELALYSKFCNLVLKLLPCFSEHLECSDKRLSLYFRHKLLMLMTRVIPHTRWQSSHPLLKLLRNYFQDLLYEPISGCDVGLENCLEGSPFLSSIADVDRVHYLSTRHLRRRAIFLFFKCCFILGCISNEGGDKCSCAKESSSFSYKLQLCSENCCHIGLSELLEWFKRCACIDTFVDHENYSKSCNSFGLSFLQLYTEEDDMLFDMLLQLLDAPFITLQKQSNGKEKSFEEMKRDILFHISSIFNPIHLFHMFLSLLNYDHLVLLDYLISKDTGVHCVQYLLRCLRLICTSWHVFMEFSICESEIYKRRKIYVDEESSNSMLGPSSSSFMITRGYHARRDKIGSKALSINQTFEKAKNCLLSLNKKVEDLHQKNLFPYNPKALLRSFARFQELCKT